MAGISTIECDRCGTSVEYQRQNGPVDVEAFPGIENIQSYKWKDETKEDSFSWVAATVDLCYECAIEHALAVKAMTRLNGRVLAAVLADPKEKATERIIATLGDRIGVADIADRSKVRDEVMNNKRHP